MGEVAVFTDIYPLPVLFDIALISGTVIVSVQRTVAEQAVQPFSLRHIMAGVVFTVSVFKVFI